MKKYAQGNLLFASSAKILGHRSSTPSMWKPVELEPSLASFAIRTSCSRTSTSIQADASEGETSVLRSHRTRSEIEETEELREELEKERDKTVQIICVSRSNPTPWTKLSSRMHLSPVILSALKESSQPLIQCLFQSASPWKTENRNKDLPWKAKTD